MSWYYYDDAQELKASIQREIEKRKKRGETFEPVAVEPGKRKIAHSFWGKAWCDNLESYRDYENRIPRGRSYLRQGNVYNLDIAPGLITSLVTGSYIYEVSIRITPLAPAAWKQIKKNCEGQVGGLLDLLSGKLGDGVLRTITDPEHGLFPKPKEIRFSCSCPDVASMCKHIAATLYGVGVKLDTAPDLFFILRSVDPSELLSATDALKDAQGSDAALAGEDLSALFGIDFAADATPVEAAPSPEKSAPKKKKPVPLKPKKIAAKKPTKQKVPTLKKTSPPKKAPAKSKPAAKKPKK